MRAPRLRNIAFKLALIVMSAALAAFGMLGWANAANALDALHAQSWGALDPLWPVYVVAAVACLAAQVIAACAVVNFARLASAPAIWRFLAFAFYAVAVFFAAYSADKGAQVVLSSAHRAVYQARETDRIRLQTEITTLSNAIEEERRKLPADTTNTVTSRQQAALAIFQATTAAAQTRLPAAQRELDALPAIPREETQAWQLALGVFAIFLAWAILEPWGYALAERGRETNSQPPAPFAPHAKAPWLRRVAAWLAFAWVSHHATQALAAEAPSAKPLEFQEPISLSAAMDAKAQAFSMRGRFSPTEIAAKVGVHPSTIYRWFGKRDSQAKAA